MSCFEKSCQQMFLMSGVFYESHMTSKAVTRSLHWVDFLEMLLPLYFYALTLAPLLQVNPLPLRHFSRRFCLLHIRRKFETFRCYHWLTKQVFAGKSLSHCRRSIPSFILYHSLSPCFFSPYLFDGLAHL